MTDLVKELRRPGACKLSLRAADAIEARETTLTDKLVNAYVILSSIGFVVLIGYAIVQTYTALQILNGCGV